MNATGLFTSSGAHLQALWYLKQITPANFFEGGIVAPDGTAYFARAIWSTILPFTDIFVVALKTNGIQITAQLRLDELDGAPPIILGWTTIPAPAIANSTDWPRVQLLNS